MKLPEFRELRAPVRANRTLQKVGESIKMRQKKRGLRILGLSLLAVLSLMALGASTAAASGQWLVPSGTAFSGTETFLGTGLSGELLVPGIGLEIFCNKSKVTGNISANDRVLAEVLFEECRVLNNNFCKIFETKANMEANTSAGNLVAKGEGLIYLHGGKHYLLAEQHSGATSFTTYYFSPASKGCSLPLENTINGTTILELETLLTPGKKQSAKALLDMEIQLLFREELSATFGANGDKLFYGTEPAELHGGLAEVHLSGPHAGQSWSGD